MGEIRSPFRFPGSKAQALKFLMPIWENFGHVEYREPFVGGGAVFFAKVKSRYNWLNDIDPDITTTYKVMSNPKKRVELIKMLNGIQVDREKHTEIKNMVPTDDVEIAFKTYYLSRTSYSGIINKAAWGYHPKKSVPPSRWAQRIEEAGKKLEGVKITNYDFTKVINANGDNKVFMFIDPPYFNADQKRAYTHAFELEDHLRLEKTLRNTDHAFCLTYDNCDEVKDLYSWANITEVSWRYHTANANKAKRKMGMELIITNFATQKKIVQEVISRSMYN